MRIVGRPAQLDGQTFFLGKVIGRTARGHSVEANPKYMRDVLAVHGLVDSGLMATRQKKKKKHKQAVCRTAVGKLLYMCQERADIMHSVKETARKTLCPTSSAEMNVKRTTRNLKGVSGATCLSEIITFPQSVNVSTDSDWAGQRTTCRIGKGGPVQCDSATLSAWSRTQQSVSLSSAEAELYALTSGTAEGMVTKHFLKELGYEVNLENHVDSQPSKAGASERGLRRMKHHMFVQDVVEKKQTTPAYVNTKSHKADFEDTVPYLRSAHERMRNAGSETLLRRRKSRLKPFDVM